MIDKLFKKDKYFNCFHIMHSIHFFYDNIRACCSNVPGPVFYENYDGRKIDWDYVYKTRKNYLKNINSFFNKKDCPSECTGCYEISDMYSNSKPAKFPNIIKRVYIQNNMSCNARCTYCSFRYYGYECRYKVLPAVTSMIENKILDKKAYVYMSGGEITISPEFEELFSVLTDYMEERVEIFTSGIKYSEAVKNAFIQDKCTLVISLDSADRETFKKIKQADSFDKVTDNIKSYIAASDNAKYHTILKYILVDGVNDNLEQIEAFIHLVKNIGVNNIRMDVDWEKYRFAEDSSCPAHYFDLYRHFNNLASEAGLNIKTSSQAQAILLKNAAGREAVK